MNCALKNALCIFFRFLRVPYPRMAAILYLHISFSQDFFRHNQWVNFNEKTHTVRIDNPIGSSSICFLISKRFFFINFFTTWVYFIPELLAVAYAHGILQQYYDGFHKNAAVTSYRILSPCIM